VLLSQFVFVPENPTFWGGICLYIHTFPKLPPYSLVNRRTIITIVVAQNWFDSLGGFHGMVMRHCGEQMVRYMGVSYVMQYMVPDSKIPWQAKRGYFLPETLKARYNDHPRVRVIPIVNNLPGGLDVSLEVHLSSFFGLGTKTSSRSRLPVLL
jgi:hypothetical protein